MTRSALIPTARSRRSTLFPAAFFLRDTAHVARDLIGALLVRASPDGVTAGRIVETEAYLAQNDAACHASSGKRTRRNESMFGAAGIAYVYMIHSRWCFNVVTQPVGVPSAVLIRALEPVEGEALMAERRGLENPLELARGPAKLCLAMAIDKSHDGHDLTAGRELWLEADKHPPTSGWPIVSSGRVGISAACELPLRFFVPGNRFVSKPSWAKRFPARQLATELSRLPRRETGTER
jgi:DNA-3-methyladenine glycosylase